MQQARRPVSAIEPLYCNFSEDFLRVHRFFTWLIGRGGASKDDG
jgi:hypothetical protein